MWGVRRRGSRSCLCYRVYDDLVRFTPVVAGISDTSRMSLCPLGGLLLIPLLCLVLRILGFGTGIERKIGEERFLGRVVRISVGGVKKHKWNESATIADA